MAVAVVYHVLSCAFCSKTRLAKFLLQRVLRQWAVRDADVVQVVDVRGGGVLSWGCRCLLTVCRPRFLLHVVRRTCGPRPWRSHKPSWTATSRRSGLDCRRVRVLVMVVSRVVLFTRLTRLTRAGGCADWEQKKLMAPGAEPPAITRLMAAIREHTHGLSLAGAGGGGFMVGIAKSGASVDAIKECLANPEFAGCSLHTAAIDTEGLRVRCTGAPPS